jgi:phosphohistidine swiveling domain-containing protein
MPVCNGSVTARACVINNFSEIGQLQKGDILITYSTDIGWSPYFPILSGICTEIGGLISHGAVVARECNLPCIVGASQATEKIKHGEMITLNGDEGIIFRAK